MIDRALRSCSLAAGALAALLLVVLPSSAWAVDGNEDIVVRVTKNGQHIGVDVDCPVDAPASVVWEVLTDYDHMAQFVSNLEHSGIEDSAGDVLRVRQKGRASRGPLTVTFENVREVELVPRREIRSRLISGDLKASDFVTRIVEVDGRIHVVNSGRYIPNIWVPPLIGPALIEAETRKQFGEIRAEILRRSAMPRMSVQIPRPSSTSILSMAVGGRHSPRGPLSRSAASRSTESSGRR